MSPKVMAAVLSAVAVLSSIGCSAGPSKAEFDAQQKYIDQLEARLKELEKCRAELDTLTTDLKFNQAEQEMYDQLAKELTALLRGMNLEKSADGQPSVEFDPKTGKWTFATDLLFDSGKDTISAKGQEVLKKFADTYRTQSFRFRIVGHTDRDPIAHKETKMANPSGMQLELGFHRALRVAAILMKDGIRESRMFIESQGNNQPVAPNDNSAANKKKNRRVEIYIVPGDASTNTTPVVMPKNTGKGTKKK